MKFYSGLSNVLNFINNLKLKVIRRKIFDEWKITRSTVAETRRAANDVTLWDHSYATAAIMKALLVQDVLSNFTISFLEGERVKQHFSFRLNILGVGWDASRILGEAQDLLGISGRERLIEKVKEKVKDILEFEIPVGNCVYEDNNSVCFLVPENIDLVLAEIKRKVVSEVAELSDGVIIPAICINKKANPYPSELITEVLEELNKRAKAPISQEKIEIRDIKWIKEWNGIKEGEVCVECGKRPRMKDRDICWRCQEFRIEGLNEIKGAFAEVQDETVWLDEIADKNGNIALICGSIPLEKWLNGEMLKTIFVKTLNDVLNPERVIDGRNPWKIWENKNYSQIRSVLEKKRYEGIVDVVRTFIQESEIQESEHQKQADKRNIQVFSNFNVPKNPLPVYLSIKSRTGLDPKRFAEVLFTKPPSPSRLLRIWTEIQEFLEELFNSTQTFTKEKVGGHCLRLKIKPRFEARDEEFFGRGENKYQTYDLEEIEFDSRIKLPKTDLWWDGEYFYTTTRLENYTEGETLEKKQRIIEENVENLKIKDFPIVLRVKKSIKGKKEEVKVKVRVEDVKEEKYLPIKSSDEISLKVKRDGEKLEITSKSIGIYQPTWKVSTKLGDGKEDFYYPNLFVRDKDGEKETYFEVYVDEHNDEPVEAIINFSELDEDEILIYPSLFDYQFLKSGIDRFSLLFVNQRKHDIIGNKGPRPYLLEDVDKFERLKEIFETIGSWTPIRDIEALAASKRQEWSEKGELGDRKAIYEELIDSALENKLRRFFDGKNWGNNVKPFLLSCIMEGSFFDAIELFESIMKMELKGGRG